LPPARSHRAIPSRWLLLRFSRANPETQFEYLAPTSCFAYGGFGNVSDDWRSMPWRRDRSFRKRALETPQADGRRWGGGAWSGASERRRWSGGVGRASFRAVHSGGGRRRRQQRVIVEVTRAERFAPSSTASMNQRADRRPSRRNGDKPQTIR
jgi:hypothetical protein